MEGYKVRFSNQVLCSLTSEIDSDVFVYVLERGKSHWVFDINADRKPL